jgi:hypothetical protein
MVKAGNPSKGKNVMKTRLFRFIPVLMFIGILTIGTVSAAAPRQQLNLPTQLESDSTIAAIRVNLNKLDIEKTEQYARQLLGDDFPELTKQLEWLKAAYHGLKDAGVNQFLFAFREEPGGRDQPFVAFQTKPGTSLIQMKIALQKIGGPPPDEDDVVWSQQGRWFIAQSDEVTEGSLLTSTERAVNFRQGFQNLRAYPIAAVFSIPPKLAAEGVQELGQGLRDGMITEAGFNLFTSVISSRWLGGGIDPGESFKATVLARAQRPADAQKIEKALQTVKAEDPFLKERPQPIATMIQALSVVDAKANRAAVRADFDWDTAQKAFSHLGQAMTQARGQAQMAMMMNNMKQILLAMHMYELDNGKLPDSLDQLDKYLGASQQVLTNPVTGEYPGYIYEKPAESLSDIKNPATTAILWEAKDGKPNPDGAKGFADGHVQRN